MKKVEDILAELGFKKHSSLETQKAFLKNLCEGVEEQEKESEEKQQLALDLGRFNVKKKKRKTAS